MKALLRYLIPYRNRMTVGLTIKMTATLAELMLPYILSHILKNVVVVQDISLILLWGGAMILFAAIACVGNIIANRMAARVSADFARQMRQDLFDSTLRLSAAQADRFTIPSLESRITSDTYNAHSFINMMQRMGVRAPILLIGGMAITLMMDAYLALAMLAVLPLIFVTVYFISRKGVPLYSGVQQAVDRMIRVVREDIQGIRVIKALSKTEYEHRRYDTANADLVKKDTHAGVIMGSVNPIMTLLMNGGIVAVVALAASRVARGQSDPETVIAFMQYFTLISMAMMSVTRMFVMYTKCAASARRIAEVLETDEDLPVLSEGDYPREESGAHIRFDHVSFSYTGKRQELEDISFTLPRGGRLGIIGATGSGKSTLIKLLLRFYDVTEGSVYINGQDIRTMDKASLYAIFGTAMQQDFLYDDTIEENIRFGREIPHDDVVRAAAIAQADGFITAFPDGYAHKIAAGGTNISGGQKQRLLIARALAAQPDILILDDSSSALDYKTDAALRRGLAESMANTTVVTVAQRVSTVKDCDRILVLEEGRVIGDGTHEQLLADCPTYREISDSQMGGAFVD
ncbi:MAG: ABC transporter ATP-binding protein [Ruminococcaceae bacterium]|nr:ABC transporter ATP-binding protein [Oscillospiraceae bacterium]